MANTYTVSFKDAALRNVVYEADGFSPPEDEEWGHVLFYTGDERDPTIIASVSYAAVLAISKQPPVAP